MYDKKMNHFHYSVDSLFYRKDIGDKFDFLMNNGNLDDSMVKTQKEFHNESPILAREAAFGHFQSYVEVLYEGIKKKYSSDERARIDLQKYFNSGNDVELMGSKPNKFKISDDLFNGINIYMVIDVPLTKKEKKGDKFLIHGIRYIDYPDKPDDEIISTIKGLVKECEYYELGQYSFGQYYSFIDFDKIGGKIETILKTPFDWDAFTEKYEDFGLLSKNLKY